jgi:hypothetical protein
MFALPAPRATCGALPIALACGTSVVTISPTRGKPGTGSRSFIAPDSPKVVPREVKARGGSLAVFGYATFTIIRE